ncbi:MAG: hypothetical protein KF799_03730 [Bdellovibrionales bacterium]|nr:hypothetical protein [Bdellovibrionales bacterium]
MTSARKLNPSPSWTLDLKNPKGSKVDAQCIGLGDGLQPEQVIDHALTLGLQHVLQEKGFEFEKEMRSANVLIQSPESFRNFPIASILAPEDLSRVSEEALTEVDERFHSSGEKRGILEAVTKSMESKGLSQTMVEDVLSVADELFTNAVFNAPFVDMKTQVNPGVNRHDTEVRFEGDKYGRLFLAHDESRLVIGVEDPFGSLNLRRYMSKIKDTYLRGPGATMNFGPGGAGLGSYIIFNAGSSLYFGVWPGSATILCCVIPLGMSYRKRVQLPKHLHWIQR